jgi:deazaflavin-dependent oxidoreductase (nitroreductase family)
VSAGFAALAQQDYCYLTTAGRMTGKPHEIEIWFALEGTTLYLLSGGGERSDWVKNLRRAPEVRVRIGRRRFAGRARVVAKKAEDALARRLLFEKYTPGDSGSPSAPLRAGLTSWRDTALPVAIDLDAS